MSNTVFWTIVTTDNDTVPGRCCRLPCIFFTWRTALILIGAVFLTAIHESHVVIIIMVLHHVAPLGGAGVPVISSTGPWAAYTTWLLAPCKLLAPSWDCVVLGIMSFPSNHLWQDASPCIDEPITNLKSNFTHKLVICISILEWKVPFYEEFHSLCSLPPNTIRND